MICRRTVATCGAALLASAVLGLASAAQTPPVVPARPSAGCSKAGVKHGRGQHRTIDVAGTTRAYVLDVPDSIEPRTPVPLLLDFHGFGHSADGVWKVSKFRDLAPHDRFITIYPDGQLVHLLGSDRPGWEISTTADNRDLAFTGRLLDETERTYCIDRNRIFATGFSNGAFFSHLLGCTMADRFAAIAPVSGGLVTAACAPARGVPVLIHHGRHDPLVDVEAARKARDAWVEKNGCRTHSDDGCEWHRDCRDGADVGYCEDDGAHHWPVPATERIWEFFRSHPMMGRN